MTGLRSYRQLDLDIRPEDWDPIGDSLGDGVPEWARLFGPTISIAGLPMHVEAYAVKQDADGVQCAAVPQLQEYVDAVFALDDTAFQTAEINGRDYIIVAFPCGA